MAGVKGRSGGARPGAGRKRKDGATPRVRGSVWMKTRARILERDSYKCQCAACHDLVEPLLADEVDHIVPLIDGGADEDSNLQALNAKCHKQKSIQENAERAAKLVTPPAQADDSLEFLRGVMNDMAQDPKLRVRAAITLAQYEHVKPGEAGKKEQRQQEAEKVAGRFKSAAPPKLVTVGGKKV